MTVITDAIKNYFINKGYKESSDKNSFLLTREAKDCFYNVLLVNYNEKIPAKDYIAVCGNIKTMQKVYGAARGYGVERISFLCIMVLPDALLDEEKRQIIEHVEGLWVVCEDTRSVHIYENQPDEFDSSFEELSDVIKAVKKPKPFIPWATAAIILANAVVFVLMYVVKGGVYGNEAVVRFADSYETVLGDKEWFRLFTSMFLHGSPGHLYSNMLLLGFLGYDFEKTLGHIYFVLLYIGTGLAASFGSVMYHYSQMQSSFSLGASGAIMGVLGALCMIAFFNRKRDGSALLRRILFYLGYVLVQGMLETDVDNAAHLCGFMAGVVFAFLTRPWTSEKDGKISA